MRCLNPECQMYGVSGAKPSAWIEDGRERLGCWKCGDAGDDELTPQGEPA